MTDVVSVLKKAKELFVTHPEYWGMCFCIEVCNRQGLIAQ